MKWLSNIRSVVFDLDDTLWPCEPTILNAEVKLYEWLKKNYPRITNEYSLDDMRKQRASFALLNPHIAHDVTALRKQSLAELAKKFDYPYDVSVNGLLLFRKYRNRVSLFDDSLPTLRELKKHFILGVITNGNADLEAIGLNKHFDFIVTAEEAGSAKPDQMIFDYARNKVKLETHQLLYVGDHPVNDVLGSRNSGWKSLWFNPSNKVWMENIQPDAEINKLSELPGLLCV
jgi:putative hydrolase of the HAD superfamily